jgi:peptidoglycan/xylan/chitin deacetylase (PgdA/CDA1 family)
MLTFDMDGASGLLRREPSVAERPSVMSMGDFGPEAGAPRILELLGGHGIPASWFVPGWVAERHPGAVKAVVKAGHEVAHHGYMHEAPATIPSRREEAELLDRATRVLEQVTGQRILGYRSPAWDISQHTLGLLAERGFIYDSSLMGHDVPYFVDVKTGRMDAGRKALPGRTGRTVRRLVEVPVHWSLDDAPYYPFNPAINRTGTLSSPQVALDTWVWEFDMAYRHGAAFILTMHPYISGHWSRINGLDRLVRHIKGHRGVEFMRCIDVAQGWTQDGFRAVGGAVRSSLS